jgi:peptide/nickel transport system substrate-binding protein
MLVALVGSLALVAASCGGNEGGGTTGATGGTSGATGASGPVKGGVLRESLTDFGFTNGFDPTGEYLGYAWAWYQQMLTRGLVAYPFIEGADGNVVTPDIATDLGQVSADGLTYTFTLKTGVKFAPPVNREVTSADILYAFQRINTASLAAQYGNYYCGTIVGMTCNEKSVDTPIEGITTPDDHTIVFTLERPTGDFLYRLAMPATSAIPKEVAGCFTQAGDYGRYVVSSGPYMIMGSDKADATSCDTLKPFSGYDPDKFMYLVRNPNYDPSTDDLRDANFDGFYWTKNTNLDDIYAKVQAGDLDIAYGSPPAAVLQQYLTNPDLQDKLKVNDADRTWYIFMNQLVPPFDDLHVRRAVNYVVDKAAMLQAAGGESAGQVATGIEPPSVLPDTATYDPYPSPDNAGDPAAAKEEMKQSKYDSNGDGKCDDPVCDNIVMINRNYSPWTEYTPILTQDLAQIGLNVKIRELDTSTAYTTVQTQENLIGIGVNTGWGKDYGSPFGFDYFEFNTAGIACTGNSNYGNIGMTEQMAKECGPKVLAAWNAVTNNGANPLISVDADMDKCVATPQGPDYNACWAAVDKKIMEDIAPWVPYRWATNITVIGDSVTTWGYDQSSGVAAYAHIAVDNGLTMDQLVGA